jgi:predicted homoserine dehydrogenase-like protein
MVAELIAVAKRDLKPGDELDGAGGYAVYGLSERYGVARQKKLLPFGFAYRGKVIRAVLKDQALSWDDVSVPKTDFLYGLREEQDRRFG